MLLGLTKPKYEELQNTYVHLKNTQINDHDPKSELPVHIILDISGYTKSETQEQPRVCLLRQSIAELNMFGWVNVSPGQKT